MLKAAISSPLQVSVPVGSEGGLRSLSTASGDPNMLFLQSPAASGNAAPNHFPAHSEVKRGVPVLQLARHLFSRLVRTDNDLLVCSQW